mmetsp:Transcript_45980/g.103866  ORF Transcript_45980/g.103866 Transcript_45980/m.103866 type:complete len:395 (-) Transcript_45980:322-1506(-)|eukprot:CAMPEP_0172645880 /NCGR_PEP_ID=MMETSP1068-20121228/239957_1 /TAXON_ID=35684 /ORGANISM="Pseudopedinella elastica, Strain CCMP716" /LENGTH=394 /DNA_ID=CAMNT_0013460129 /DNA_START=102 /DNA_END=1286 /DNA_ORIENTATION=+
MRVMSSWLGSWVFGAALLGACLPLADCFTGPASRTRRASLDRLQQRWSSVGSESDVKKLESKVEAQAAEIVELRTAVAELKQKQETGLAEMAELANLISYQLDRVLALEDPEVSTPVGADDLDDDLDEEDEEGNLESSPAAAPAAASSADGGGLTTGDLWKMFGPGTSAGSDGGSAAAAASASAVDESRGDAMAASTPTEDGAGADGGAGLKRKPVLPPASCRAMRTAAEDGIRIGDAGAKGLGAFATKAYTEGETVGDYEGEWLGLRDLDVRYPHTAPLLKPGDPPRPTANLADIEWRNDRMRRGVGLSGDYIFGAGENIFVDGEDIEKSNWGRFINHAPELEKDPACNLRCKTLASDMFGKPRVWFVAIRDIAPGEELLFDYGDTYWDEEEV